MGRFGAQARGEREARLGGMALANGLLVHGPDHWAAAVRDDDGRLVVASGRRPRVALGPFEDLPLVRGVVRLGEALVLVPAARRAVPEARLAFERRSVALAMVASTAVAALARRRLRWVLAQEAVSALAGLAPALVALRGSDAAVWHGVEHKSIAAWEAGGAEGVEDASGQAKEHRRCGGNLILPLLVTSTLGNTVARSIHRPTLAMRAGVAAVSLGAAVEVFVFAARRPRHPLARLIHGFGHAVQARFTTREAGEPEMVVGRAAMRELLRVEGPALSRGR